MTDIEKFLLIKEAFIAGFKASGEGWNGEYPYEQVDDERIWEDVQEEFNAWLHNYEKDK